MSNKQMLRLDLLYLLITISMAIAIYKYGLGKFHSFVQKLGLTHFLDRILYAIDHWIKVE